MPKKRLGVGSLFMLEDKEPDKPVPSDKERVLTANDLVGKRHRKKKPKLKLS